MAALRSGARKAGSLLFHSVRSTIRPAIRRSSAEAIANEGTKTTLKDIPLRVLKNIQTNGLSGILKLLGLGLIIDQFSNPTAQLTPIEVLAEETEIGKPVKLIEEFKEQAIIKQPEALILQDQPIVSMSQITPLTIAERKEFLQKQHEYVAKEEEYMHQLQKTLRETNDIQAIENTKIDNYNQEIKNIFSEGEEKIKQLTSSWNPLNYIEIKKIEKKQEDLLQKRQLFLINHEQIRMKREKEIQSLEGKLKQSKGSIESRKQFNSEYAKEHKIRID